MKDRYHTFLAFFIPISIAILLIFFYSDLFPSPSTGGISFSIFDENISGEKLIYVLLIGGLFILSFILPVFVDLRTDPIERIELNLTSKQK